MITSSERTLTTFEKMQLARRACRYRAVAAAAARLRPPARRARDVDDGARVRARRCRRSCSARLSGSGELPLPREACEADDSQLRPRREAEPRRLRARARRRCRWRRRDARSARRTARDERRARPRRFPPPVQSMVALGRCAPVDYQDAALRRRSIASGCRASSPRSGRPTRRERRRFAATREAARYLASWMAFDDVVRVADLKSRASRIARVRSEVKAPPDDVLRDLRSLQAGRPGARGPAAVRDSPTRLVRWDRRRVAQGREPFGWPIKLPVHAVTGLAMLRADRQPEARATPWLALRDRAGDDRALAGGGRARTCARTGSSATRSPSADGSSRVTARPTSAARRACCTSSIILAAAVFAGRRRAHDCDPRGPRGRARRRRGQGAGRGAAKPRRTAAAGQGAADPLRPSAAVAQGRVKRATMKTTHYTVSVEFGDCDPAGIVFFPNFLRWIDSSSRHYFVECGVPVVARDRAGARHHRHADRRRAGALRGDGDVRRPAKRGNDGRRVAQSQLRHAPRRPARRRPCSSRRLKCGSSRGERRSEPPRIEAVAIPAFVREACEAD